MTEAAARPLPARLKLQPGVRVGHLGRQWIIVRVIALTLLLVEDAETGERIHAQVGDVVPWTGNTPDRRKIPDLSEIPAEKRKLGLKRLAVLRDLMALKYRTRQDVATAGAELQLSVAQVYALMSRLRREGTWTCLAPHTEKGKPRKKRLNPLVEELIQEAINRVYFNRHNAPMAEVVREAERLCKGAGQKAPVPNSIIARIRSGDARATVAARRGEKEARDKFDPVLGPQMEVLWPLHRVQIDHTVADLFVVDEITGRTIGRPILTLVIDEFSRAVLGFHLSLRPPSTLSVALALTQAVFLKENFCRQHSLTSRWDVYGLPHHLLSDNAAEFDSAGLIAGCAQHGIHGCFRPLGRPHFGGRIERLIGTLMGRLKLLPGASMRSIAERGEGYDPEREAAYTLADAETRIATEIVEIYHRTTHGATGVTPLKLWEFGILGDDTTLGRGLPDVPSDPRRFLLDFLPQAERSVQDYGIQLHNTRYHAPVLRAFCTGRKGGGMHTIRYDPRDLSQVFFYDSESAEYHAIPRVNAHFSPTALWEVKAATRHLRDKGQDPDDENAIHRAIEKMRQMDAEAIGRSKRARRNVEMRRLDAKGRMQGSTGVPDLASSAPAKENAVTPPPASKPRARPIADVEGW